MSRYTVKVLPRTSRNQVEQIAPTELRVKMTAAPVEGKANEMLIKILAKHFGVRKAQVTIVSGVRSRQKVVEIAVK